MAFGAYGTSGSEGSSGGTKVDFNELNKYTVETADLKRKEVLVGYVSVICDLGMQELPDAEVVFTGTPEEEEDLIADKPQTYFKDGYDYESKKDVRFKCWPQTPRQCVALAVDFPDIILDKGQFFGESNPLPLRMWLGGEFYDGKSMVIGRPTAMKITKTTGEWSFDKKHLFHKMAVGAKLIESDGVFLPQDIDQLLGLSFQFEAQIYFKKNKGKEYYTENVKFTSGLGRGQTDCELIVEPQILEFFSDNSQESVKSLRAHVVNTAKKALNYEGSTFQKNVEEYREGKKPSDDSDDSNDNDDDSPINAPEVDNSEFDDVPESVTEPEKPKAKSKPKAKAKADPVPAEDDEEVDGDDPF